MIYRFLIVNMFNYWLKKMHRICNPNSNAYPPQLHYNIYNNIMPLTVQIKNTWACNAEKKFLKFWKNQCFFFLPFSFISSEDWSQYFFPLSIGWITSLSSCNGKTKMFSRVNVMLDCWILSLNVKTSESFCLKHTNTSHRFHQSREYSNKSIQFWR